VTASPADPGAAIRRDYELAERVGTKPVWDSFISNYPSGFYTDLAKAQRDKLAAEAASVAATEKARAAVDEQKRLAIEGAKATEQAKAAAQALAAEELRILAEKRKVLEEASVAAEKAKAAGDKKAQDEKPVGQLATLPPAQQSGAAIPQPDQAAAAEIPRLLQSELRRVGCSTGPVDKSWTASAQRSLSLFNKNAKTNFDVKVASLDALDAVRGRTSRVCPLICDHGYRADGEACIRITCKAGFELGDDNSCERIVPRKRTVARERRHERRSRSSGGKCFSYGGVSYCE
jgi:hypothetical protein